MNLITLIILAITAGDSREATSMFTAYRDAGNGSNRTNPVRVVGVLSAVLSVIRTGRPVEVTSFYEGENGISPAYNIVHRQLSHGLIRPMWHKVQTVALVDVVQKGNKVTGRPDTRATFAQGARVFICPVE